MKTENGWHDSFSVHQEGYEIKDNQIFLSQGNFKNKRQPKIVILFELTNPLQGTPKIITISWKKDCWKINLTSDIETPPQIPKLEIKKINGIDRNVRKLFANSDGWKYYNPYYWEKVENDYIELQRKLSKKEKGSNNWKKVKLEMKKLGEKASNRMKNVCHKTTRKLVNKNDLLVYERLEPSEMISKENKKIGRWTRDGIMKACWTQQVQFATYKVKETGKWIWFVNPHNTSKRCSKCGEINYQLKDEEVFECPFCPNIMDRDVNAARNICWKAEKELKIGVFAPTG